MELTIADFLELPQNTQQHQSERKSIPTEKEFSDDSMEITKRNPYKQLLRGLETLHLTLKKPQQGTLSRENKET